MKGGLTKVRVFPVGLVALCIASNACKQSATAPPDRARPMVQEPSPAVVADAVPSPPELQPDPRPLVKDAATATLPIADADGQSDAPPRDVDDVFDPEAERADAGDWEARAAVNPTDQQCNRILDRAWVAMKPALRKLRVRATEKVEADYRGMRTRDSSWTADESNSFLGRCRRLSAQQRDCIERASHPVAGLYRCKVLFSGPRELRPYPPTVYDHVTLVRPPTLPRLERTQLIERLAGSWTNDNPDDGYERVWSLDATGKGRETITRDGGRTLRARFTLRVKRRDRLVRREVGRRLPELWTFFALDDTTFFASAEGYGVYRAPNPTRFVVDAFGDFVFWEGPRDGQERDCEIVSATGLMTRGRCRNGTEAFAARWGFAEQLDAGGKPRRRARRWVWRGQVLVDERLLRRGRFTRRDP